MRRKQFLMSCSQKSMQLHLQCPLTLVPGLKAFCGLKVLRIYYSQNYFAFYCDGTSANFVNLHLHIVCGHCLSQKGL